MKIASKYDVPKNENHKLYDEINNVTELLTCCKKTTLLGKKWGGMAPRPPGVDGPDYRCDPFVSNGLGSWT
jgi:hypothetical protein